MQHLIEPRAFLHIFSPAAYFTLERVPFDQSYNTQPLMLLYARELTSFTELLILPTNFEIKKKNKNLLTAFHR